MAIYNSVQDGNWTNPATWGETVNYPNADGDVVNIYNNVTMNYDATGKTFSQLILNGIITMGSGNLGFLGQINYNTVGSTIIGINSTNFSSNTIQLDNTDGVVNLINCLNTTINVNAGDGGVTTTINLNNCTDITCALSLAATDTLIVQGNNTSTFIIDDSLQAETCAVEVDDGDVTLGLSSNLINSLTVVNCTVINDFTVNTCVCNFVNSDFQAVEMDNGVSTTSSGCRFNGILTINGVSWSASSSDYFTAVVANGSVQVGTWKFHDTLNAQSNPVVGTSPSDKFYFYGPTSTINSGGSITGDLYIHSSLIVGTSIAGQPLFHLMSSNSLLYIDAAVINYNGPAGGAMGNFHLGI